MRSAFPALLLALYAAPLFEVSEAQAQVIPSAYTYVEERQEVGLFAGSRSAGKGRFGYGPAGGQLWGARYGLELAGPLSIEGILGTMHGMRDIINPGRPEGDRVIGEGDVLLTTIDARLKLTATGNRAWHGLSPFMVFGGGVAFDLADTPAAQELLEPEDVFEFGTSFFGTLGLGTRWFVTDRIALRTDGVFSLWQLDTPPGFGGTLYGFEDVPEAEWVQALSFTASLLFRW